MENYKLYLYKPNATANDFLGELLVDNLQVNIKLHEMSSISFTMPEIINGVDNIRLDEVLDGYVVELWYGRVTGVENTDYFKIRFILHTTPLDYNDFKRTYSYEGFSFESILEFKQINNWEGVQIRDFYREPKYDNSTTGQYTEVAAAGQTIPNHPYAVTAKTIGTGNYIKIAPTTATATPLDIYVYEVREDTSTDVYNEIAYVRYTGATYNEVDFKQGYYFLDMDANDQYVEYIYIYVPNNYEDFDGQVSTKKLSFKVYDNPISRHYAVGVNRNDENPYTDMYIDLAQDAEDGDAAEYGNYSFITQPTYSKNGLKLEHVLLGNIESRDAGLIDNNALTSDGLLYNTDFTIGTVHPDIAAKYRSNLEYNNITVYQSIRDLAESFDAIPVFDTVLKTVSFYPENADTWPNNGLILKYGTYLKNIKKDIDASKIVTAARGIGKDNLNTIALVTPDGSDSWQDFSHYLDEFYIDPEISLSQLNADGFEFTLENPSSGVYYLGISYPDSDDTSTYQSRWMEAAEAKKVAKWQFNRDFMHKILLGEIRPSDVDYSGLNLTALNTYYDLYNIRSAAINDYVQSDTTLSRRKAESYRYKYLYDFYDKKVKAQNPFDEESEDSVRFLYYKELWEDTEAAVAAQEIVVENKRLAIFTSTVINSIGDKLNKIRTGLNKIITFSINVNKLDPFIKEFIVNDSKLDNDLDLLDAVVTHVNENKTPRITIDVGIVDILAAQEAYEDWNKLKVGDLVSVYYPEFNINQEVQIRELSIDFEAHTASIVISSVRNYNKGYGNYVSKVIKRLSITEKNIVNNLQDSNRVSNKESNENYKTLNGGLIDTEKAKVILGSKDEEGNSSTSFSGTGFESKTVENVDPLFESFNFGLNKSVVIKDGIILASYRDDADLFTSEVEISADKGFEIRKVTGSVEGEDLFSERKVYIDINGNAIFAGALSAATGTFAGELSAATGSFTGSITANSGSIGGWTINSDGIFTGTFDESAYTTSGITISNNGSIHSPNFYLDSTGITTKAGNIGGFTIDATSLTAGATTTSVGVTTDAVAFYAGDATPGSAPFRVTREGVLNATGATISGAITATSGTFTGTVNANAGNFTNTITVGSNAEDKISIVGGSTAQGTKIHSGVGEYNNINTGFYLDADGRFSLGDQLRWDGTTLTILGDIEADTGTIGGFSVGADFIRAGADDTKLLLKYNATNPYISIGQSATENAYNYNGIFLGLDSTIPRLSLKSATNSLLWDGANLTINGGGTFSGALAAATGSFGSVTIDAAGKITIGNTIIDNNGITAKNGTGPSADTNFSVDPSTGAINSILGFIGGWTIGNTTLSSGTTAGNYVGMSFGAGTASDISFWAGATDNTAANISAAPFRVTNIGVLNATGAIIEGTITATDGRIGSTTDGWDINANVLESKNDYIKLDAANNKILVGNITLQGAVAEGDSYIGLGKTGYTLSGTAGIYAGLDNGVAKLSIGNTTNSLTWDGVDLSVTGQITATSGAIAGFTIENTVLTAGSLSAGASGYNVGLTPDSGGSDVSIWAGASIATGTVPTDAEIALAPFRVTNTGILSAVGANISGTITASNGTIGGFTISDTTLTADNIIISSSPYISIKQTIPFYSYDGIYIGTTTDNSGTEIVPAFSLANKANENLQEFTGSYSNGNTSLTSDTGNNWVSSEGINIDYIAAANDALVIDDYSNYNSSTEPYGIFNNSTQRYFMLKGTGTTPLTKSLIYTFTSPLTSARKISFEYIVRAANQNWADIKVYYSNTNLLKTFRARTSPMLSGARDWKDDTITIPSGATNVKIEFNKTTTTNRVFAAVREIVIYETQGLYYTSDDGLSVNSGTVGGWTVTNTRISTTSGGADVALATGSSSEPLSIFNNRLVFWAGTSNDSAYSAVEIDNIGKLYGEYARLGYAVFDSASGDAGMEIIEQQISGTEGKSARVAYYKLEQSYFQLGTGTYNGRLEYDKLSFVGPGATPNRFIIERDSVNSATADGRSITLRAPSVIATSSKVINLPDASGTVALIDTTQTITGAQTFRNSAGIRVEAASTQDAIIIDGRSGGASSYAVTFIPTTLGASQTITIPNFTGIMEVSRSLGTTSISHSGAGDSTGTFTGTTHTITSRNVYRISWSIGSETNWIVSYVSIEGSSTTAVPFSVMRSSGTTGGSWFEYVGKVRRTAATTWKLVDCFSNFLDGSFNNGEDVAATTIHLREIELVSH